MELIIPGTADPTAIGILDDKGRVVIHLPREAGRLLLQVDAMLRDLKMEFALLCMDCRSKARPNLEGTDVVWKCDHARRVSSQL